MSSSLSIEQVIQHIDNVGLFPTAAQRILELTKSPSATVTDLESAVSTDSVLAGRVLKVANSPLLGRRVKVGSLRRAVQMLGFDGTRDLALALAVSGLSQPDTDLGRYLWLHSEATAWCCRVLAQNTRRVGSEELFVTGLLHDLGIQLLLAIERDKTEDLLRQFHAHESLFLRAERVHYGFDHAELGGACLRRWGLPPMVIELVETHHRPIERPCRFADKRSRALLQLADIIADKLIYGATPHSMWAAIQDHEAVEHTHMTKSAFERSFSMLIDHRSEILAG